MKIKTSSFIRIMKINRPTLTVFMGGFLQAKINN